MMTCRTAITPGTAPVIEATFADLNDNPVNPSTMTITVRDPDGEQTTYTDDSPEVSNPATGTWQLELPALTIVGVWWIYWAGTGPNSTVATELALRVRGLHVDI